jgi:hypothetical protein
MVVLRNALDDIDLEIVEAEGRATRVIEEIEEYEALIAALIPEDVSEDEAVEQLKAEVQSLEEEVKRLREAAEEESGKSARSFVGDGNRQYLTGLNLGGNIAILIDTSASMLADRLVNVIRLRNMDESLQRSADKWTRALNTVDWLTAQLPDRQRVPGHYLQHPGSDCAAGHRRQMAGSRRPGAARCGQRRAARHHPRQRHQPDQRL